VCSHFSETVDGLTTIRAFKTQSQELNRFLSLKDRNNLVAFARYVVWAFRIVTMCPFVANLLLVSSCSLAADRWIGQRIEALSSIVVLAVSMLSIYGKEVCSCLMQHVLCCYHRYVYNHACVTVRCKLDGLVCCGVITGSDVFCKS
jgi:hypothetical protein